MPDREPGQPRTLRRVASGRLRIIRCTKTVAVERDGYWFSMDASQLRVGERCSLGVGAVGHDLYDVVR